MSKLEVDAIEPQSGTTLTIGANGDSVTLGSGASVSGLTLSDNILFNAASKGIYLGVTTATASNLLDDYEEGTWTPTLAGSTTSGTYTYQAIRTGGTYRKIGNYVTVFGVFRIDGVTSAGTGFAFIEGLPFTSASTTGATSYPRTLGSMLKQGGYSDSNPIFVGINDEVNYLEMISQTATTISFIDVTDADLVNSIWGFQITYKTV